MVLRGLLDRLRPVAIEDVQLDRRRKIAGTIRAASLVDEFDQFRHGLSFGGGDLLDGAPKRLFKADTGLVAVDDDGPFAVLRVHDRLLRRTWHMHGTRHMGQFIRANRREAGFRMWNKCAKSAKRTSSLTAAIHVMTPQW